MYYPYIIGVNEKNEICTISNEEVDEEVIIKRTRKLLNYRLTYSTLRPVFKKRTGENNFLEAMSYTRIK